MASYGLSPDVFPDNVEDLSVQEITDTLQAIIDSGIVSLSGNVKDIIKLLQTDPLDAEVETYESASIGYSNMYVLLLGFPNEEPGLNIESRLPEEMRPKAEAFLRHLRATFSKMYAVRFRDPESLLDRIRNRIVAARDKILSWSREA
jgi:hypothetical protein